MSARARAALGRTDANHREIVDTYEALLCRVIDTHAVGGGFGDIVCRIPTNRGPVVHIVEIKTADGELRPNQERFAREWGSVVVCVRNREDVIAHVEAVRGVGK